MEEQGTGGPAEAGEGSEGMTRRRNPRSPSVGERIACPTKATYTELRTSKLPACVQARQLAREIDAVLTEYRDREDLLLQAAREKDEAKRGDIYEQLLGRRKP
jgi:hypothetical protein